MESPDFFCRQNEKNIFFGRSLDTRVQLLDPKQLLEGELMHERDRFWKGGN